MDEPAVISDARRAVLEAVKRHGDAAAEQVADDLAITVSGARQHLAALVERGLLDARADDTAPRGRGRTPLRYSVSGRGDALFPRAYGDLANELLGYLGRADPAAVGKLFEQRRDHRIEAAAARLATKHSFRARVRELACILDDDGYLAEFEELGGGTFRVTEHNCAILAVARNYSHACTSEIEFLRGALPDAEIERVTHIVEGAHACAYLIRPRTGPR